MALIHVVHSINTEGRLTETLEAAFHRLSRTFGLCLPPSRENLLMLQKYEFDLIRKG